MAHGYGRRRIYENPRVRTQSFAKTHGYGRRRVRESALPAKPEHRAGRARRPVFRLEICVAPSGRSLLMVDHAIDGILPQALSLPLGAAPRREVALANDPTKSW